MNLLTQLIQEICYFLEVNLLDAKLKGKKLKFIFIIFIYCINNLY